MSTRKNQSQCDVAYVFPHSSYLHIISSGKIDEWISLMVKDYMQRYVQEREMM